MNTDYITGTVPKTILELKEYCERNNLTPSKTRFFIDYDYSGAKAFGIYKDNLTGEFVVYKNKADGSRVERYRGTDEEFAVLELYDRLQSEIANQKLRYAAEMAERERNKYEEPRYDQDRIFHDEIINDFGNNTFSDNHRSNNRNSDDQNFVNKIISVIIILISIILGLAGFGGNGGYSSYNDDNYSYSSSYSHDSGWSSDNWDSGFTDWDSDW